MIKLKTLEKATAQEVFDQVANHLLTQNEKAIRDNDFCLYRHGNLKCAAGCLIADDEYQPEMDEGHSWFSLTRNFEVTRAHEYLISNLQDIHDHSDPSIWAIELENLAERRNLTYKEKP